jgi:hypothetical protein
MYARKRRGVLKTGKKRYRAVFECYLRREEGEKERIMRTMCRFTPDEIIAKSTDENYGIFHILFKTTRSMGRPNTFNIRVRDGLWLARHLPFEFRS